MRAVVLVSGGIDSAVTLRCAISMNGAADTVGLFVEHGQANLLYERHAARQIAAHYRVRLVEGSVTLWEHARDARAFVPGRNAVLLSLAAAYADTWDASVLYIGCNADDRNEYPDCRPAFINRMAQGLGKRIAAPLLEMTKRDVVALGSSLAVPIHETWSCYFPSSIGRPCETCAACRLRSQALSP